MTRTDDRIMTVGAFRRLAEKLFNRVSNLAARARVQLVNDRTKLQSIQLGLHKDEQGDDGERFQQYGFSSVPLEGAEAVVLFPGGDRSRPLVVAVDDRRYRPAGRPKGEVTIYSFNGAQIQLLRGGDVVVTPAAGRHVLLGGASASDPPLMASEAAALKAAIATWSGGGTSDSGASLKAVFAAWLAPGASKVKVE